MTRSQFDSMVELLRAQQGAEDEPVDLRHLGEDYALMLALSERAKMDGVANSPEVVKQLALAHTQILSNMEYARLLDAAKPTAAEVKEYYAAHPADFDQVQMRRLFIWKRAPGSQTGKGLSPEEAQTFATKIEQAFAGGQDVKKLVSGNESVNLDIAPLTFARGELPPYMEKPAFSIPAGEWQVLEDKPDGLILIQVVKRERRPLNEVAPSIEKKMQAQKLRAALDNVKTNAGIWLDQQYFASEDGEKKPASTSAATRAQDVPKTEKSTGERHD